MSERVELVTLQDCATEAAVEFTVETLGAGKVGLWMASERGAAFASLAWRDVGRLISVLEAAAALAQRRSFEASAVQAARRAQESIELEGAAPDLQHVEERAE